MHPRYLCVLGLAALFACRGAGPALPGTSLGEVARDIEGIDLDGVAFKLSDYKGKVVYLDFWGDW